MRRPSAKTFDCVQNMRETRDRLSAEIESMRYEELVTWLRDHRYADPVLQRLAEEAAERAEVADRSATNA